MVVLEVLLEFRGSIIILICSVIGVFVIKISECYGVTFFNLASEFKQYFCTSQKNSAMLRILE